MFIFSQPLQCAVIVLILLISIVTNCSVILNITNSDIKKSIVTFVLIKNLCIVDLCGACLVLPDRNDAAEILNLAVLPSKQGQGIGTTLLRWTLEQLSAQGIHRVELGTGSFGPQLTFYQRLGFRVTQVQRDYFLTHYAEPLFEQGIQHKDRLWLSLDLAGRNSEPF